MDIFKEENRLARDVAKSWFKFTKVGDRVGGTIKDMWEAEGRGDFPAQRCFTLETDKGELVNVGLKRTSYILTRTDNLQVGDMLGVRFEKEMPPKEKGFHPAKSLVIFTKLVGERTGQTAAQLQPTSELPGDVPTADSVPYPTEKAENIPF